MSLIATHQTESSHWYTRDGEPFYEIEMKTRPGEFRAPDVRDARKLGLLPSVTTILSIVEKKALTAWKMEQVVLAALTLPKLEDEPLDAYARRVIDDSMAESRRAAEFGTRLHAAIKRWLTNQFGDDSIDDDLAPFLVGFTGWYEANREHLVGAVVDFKTQGAKSPPLRFYDDWLYQLAAYGKGVLSAVNDCFELFEGPIYEAPFASKLGFGGMVDYVWPPFTPRTRPRLINVAISSVVPGLIEMKEWTPLEARRGWRVFQAAFKLWRELKQYDPTKGVQNCDIPKQ